MKKKVLALILCAMMAATAVVGGTLAYFTDTDADINVMTSGNVKIQQDEWQNNKTGDGYEEYKNNKPLFPYTDDDNKDGLADEWNSTIYYPDANGEMTSSTKAFSTTNNAVDKVVTVKNTGNQPAFIRTLFAFEMGEDGENPLDSDKIAVVIDATDATYFRTTDVVITLDNTQYTIVEFYYNSNTVTVDGTEYKSAIEDGKYSNPSLKQIYLNSKVGNEWYENYDEDYKILVLSQAAQMTGFTSAEQALDTAFADITTENADTIQGWFASIAQEKGVSVDTVHPSAVDGKPATDGKVATTTPVEP